MKWFGKGCASQKYWYEYYDDENGTPSTVTCYHDQNGSNVCSSEKCPICWHPQIETTKFLHASAMLDHVGCMLAEGLEFMTKAQIYDSIKKTYFELQEKWRDKY